MKKQYGDPSVSENKESKKLREEIKEMEGKLDYAYFSDSGEAINLPKAEMQKFKRKNFVFNNTGHPVPHDTPLNDLFWMLDSGQIRELGSRDEDHFIQTPKEDKRTKEPDYYGSTNRPTPGGSVFVENRHPFTGKNII